MSDCKNLHVLSHKVLRTYCHLDCIALCDAKIQEVYMTKRGVHECAIKALRLRRKRVKITSLNKKTFYLKVMATRNRYALARLQLVLHLSSCGIMLNSGVNSLEESVYIDDTCGPCSDVFEYQQVQSIEYTEVLSDDVTSVCTSIQSVTSDEGGGNLEMSDGEWVVLIGADVDGEGKSCKAKTTNGLMGEDVEGKVCVDESGGRESSDGDCAMDDLTDAVTRLERDPTYAHGEDTLPSVIRGIWMKVKMASRVLVCVGLRVSRCYFPAIVTHVAGQPRSPRCERCECAGNASYVGCLKAWSRFCALRLIKRCVYRDVF